MERGKLCKSLSFHPSLESKVNSHYNCYMLLGYDILLDDKLQAHLIGESLEVEGLLLRYQLLLFFRDQQPSLSLCQTRFYWCVSFLKNLFSFLNGCYWNNFEFRYVKHPLVAEAFNIAGFHLPPGSASRHEVSGVHLLLSNRSKLSIRRTWR